VNREQTAPGGRGADANTRADQPPSRIAEGPNSVDEGLTSSKPKQIARLASYRSAAQAIRRQDATLGGRDARMIALMQQARAESDPWVRDRAQQVIWAQSEWMLESDEALRQNGIRGRLERDARRLRLAGYERCHECSQRLSDPSDWRFWAALREAEKDRLMALDYENPKER
jgi:hypothetical protein